MRIGIDVTRTAEDNTGLPSYCRSLLAALSRIDGDNEYRLYRYLWDRLPPHHERAFVLRARNFRPAGPRLPAGLVRWLWHHTDRRLLLGPPPDVFFSPFHYAPPEWVPRLIAVFHDIAFRVHPGFSTEVNRRFCEEQFDLVRRTADRILTVSHFSKREIVEHMGVPPERVAVVHEAADPRFRRIASPRLPGRLQSLATAPMLLYVGSVEPRKNLATLVRAWARVASRVPAGARLVIAGGSGWKNAEVHESIERLGISDRVRFTGFVTDDELVALYNCCTAFCYPTRYEGFGLPVIEAMACGAPVVTTRVASIPEVGGDAVLYVEDPEDEVALAEALVRVLDDGDLRATLRTAGLEQAARFDWEKTARATLDLIGEVHADRHGAADGLVVGVDERALGSGFHPLEEGPEGPFRWTQRTATVHLEAHSDQDHLRIRAASPLAREGAVLIVRVGGSVLGTARLGAAFEDHRIPLPAAAPRDRSLPIELTVNRFRAPHGTGPDPRELGIQLQEVSLAASP